MTGNRRRQEIENGVPVHYRSDVDGDRYIIIDPEDADMSGWSVEVRPDEAWYQTAWHSDGTAPAGADDPDGNIDTDDLSVHLRNALGTGNFSKDQYRQLCDALTTKSAT
jgi:hypothetical protein